MHRITVLFQASQVARHERSATATANWTFVVTRRDVCPPAQITLDPCVSKEIASAARFVSRYDVT